VVRIVVSCARLLAFRAGTIAIRSIHENNFARDLDNFAQNRGVGGGFGRDI
jgi:hypothetical protein